MKERKRNGQAFILHIWDSQDCRIDPDTEEWSPGWKLINHITHKVGVMKNFAQKMEWLSYVASF